MKQVNDSNYQPITVAILVDDISLFLRLIVMRHFAGQ